MTFVEYCKVHKLPVLTKDAFGKSMTKHKVDEGFATINGKRSRVWKGIRLTAEYDALAKKALTELNRNEKQKMNEGIEEFPA